MDEEFVINLIKNDPWRMDVLKAAKSLNLPDWLIGAGFVRNLVWDNLHEYENNPLLSDIDVVYFDPTNLSEEIEIVYQNKLKGMVDADWSVTNQARMAKINNQSIEYISTEDAIAHWPETATAIGITLRDDGQLRLIAPYGVDDLASLVIRIAPSFGGGSDAFKHRVEKKQWLLKWPKLTLVDPNRVL